MLHKRAPKRLSSLYSRRRIALFDRHGGHGHPANGERNRKMSWQRAFQHGTTVEGMKLAGRILQRKCACGNHTVAGAECKECRRKTAASQMSDRRGERNVDGDVPSIVHDVLRTPGQPLDSATRTFFEPRFGRDLSQVRLHSSNRASESARAINALAYTVGNNVVLG